MKDWNSVLLESIIRDNLFEQASAESDRVIIRPMLGLEGERKVARAKKAMGITDPVDDGFVVINRQSSTVSKPDIINAIQKSRDFGIGSRFDSVNWVYLISNNRAIGKNSSKRDVLILQSKNYNLWKKLTLLNKQYNELINQIPERERRALDIADYTTFTLRSTAIPNSMDTWIYFDEDILNSRKFISTLENDINTMKRIGP